jgi:oxygen-independent coproporphyrinogen-3 oxidase
VAQPASTSTAIYIHVPWCRSICSYCDFDRQAHAFELIPEYVAALVDDIRRQPAVSIHSIFFGGGTPSLLSPIQIETILTACWSQFRPIQTVEVTLEANPCDLDAERVASYVAAGINRFSLGLQSFDDGLLRLLGRRHSAAQAAYAVHQARAGGAANLSFDLMYALPGQSPQHWRETLERALQLRPDHLSAYLLTIDKSVPLGRRVSRGRLSLPEDDKVVEMYEDAQRLLGLAGYEQYEISNWARPGRACRHNLTYWRDEPYLGFGAGAASSFGGRRYKNSPDPAVYIRAVANRQAALVEDELSDLQIAAQDYVALSLRLREGLDLEQFASRFGTELIEAGGRDLSDLLEAQILQLQGRRLRIGDEHLLISNEIILRLHQALQRDWDRYAARPLKCPSSTNRAESKPSPRASFKASSARA